jgi:hypothetical protein
VKLVTCKPRTCSQFCVIQLLICGQGAAVTIN